jgi:hypothetical protein
MSTAAVYLHRFFMLHKFDEHNRLVRMNPIGFQFVIRTVLTVSVLV